MMDSDLPSQFTDVADLLSVKQVEPIPPPLAAPSLLPFKALSPPVFERLVAEVVLRVDRIDDVRIYGRSGQDQGGLDLIGYRNGEMHVYQVRRIHELTATKLQKAVVDFAGPSRSKASKSEWTQRRFPAARFILAAACVVEDVAIEDELSKLRHDYFGDLVIDLYDALRLSVALREHGSIVAGIFGIHWADAFCGNRGLASARSQVVMVPNNRQPVIDRPYLADRVIELLCIEDFDEADDVVAVSGLVGMGGVGKTVLAKQIGQSSLIRERFAGGVLWLTIGENVHGVDLAAKINDISTQVSGKAAAFANPEQAGQYLLQQLRDDGRRWLLVVDDVWHDDQLVPLLTGTKNCSILVTTRQIRTLPADASITSVNPMVADEARSVLVDGLPGATPGLSALLDRAGGLAVLLSLMNKALRRYVGRGSPLSEAVARVTASLVLNGPASVDLSGTRKREAAVTATIEVSFSELRQVSEASLTCFLDLAVFPEDEDIPLDVLYTYWKHVHDVDSHQVDQLCLDYADLSLAYVDLSSGRARLRLHDVVRAYLRHRPGSDLVKMNRALLDAFRPNDGSRNPASWWKLDQNIAGDYIRRYLSYHLHEASLLSELEQSVCDVRWILSVLEIHGPTTVVRHLEYCRSDLASRLREIIYRDAEIIARFDSRNSLSATLLSRLSEYEELTELSNILVSLIVRPYLSVEQPIRDDASQNRPIGRVPELRESAPFVVTALSEGRNIVAIGNDRGKVYMYRQGDSEFSVLTGEDEAGVQDVIISRDERWIASCSRYGKVYLWQLGQLAPFVLTSDSWLRGIAFDRNSSFLISGSFGGSIVLWSLLDLRQTRWQQCRPGISALSVSPDGNFIVAGHADGSARIWSKNGERLGELSGNRQQIEAVIFSSDSFRFATIHRSEVRLCTVQGQESARITVQADISAGSVSVNDEFLAIAGRDGSVRLWNLEGTPVCSLAGHTSQVANVSFSPDNRWLASVASDNSIRIYCLGTLRAATSLSVDGRLRSLAWQADSLGIVACGTKGIYHLRLNL